MHQKIRTVIAAICIVFTAGDLASAQDGMSRVALDGVFKRLDRNNDGVLTPDEVPQQQAFQRADIDRDGQVTRTEFDRWSVTRQSRAGSRGGNAPTGVETPNPDAMFRLAYVHDRPIAQSSALVDAFDNGRPDILIACKRSVHFVRNDGGFAFSHQVTFGVDNANGWGSHDFNADGRLDIFVAQQEKSRDDVWLNNGDGAFTWRDLGNETVGNTRNVLFADFDGDGFVDSYHSVSSFGTNHSGCELHPGKAGGSFAPDIIDDVLDPPIADFWYAEVNHPERGAEKWSNKMFKGAVVRDFDGDGKPDIVTGAYADLGFQEGDRGGIGQRWVEQQDRGLFVLHNRSAPGKIRFAEVAKSAIGPNAYGNTRDDWNVYAVVPIDYDRDGDFDLFAAAVVRGGTLRRPAEDTRSVAFFENVSQPGEIRFKDRTRETEFGRFNDLPPSRRSQISFASGAPIDCDNDGWVDLCLVNRRDNDKTPWPWPHLLRNTGDGRFIEVPPKEHGLGDGGGGRDLNYADLDGDGRLDLIVHDGTVGGYDGADNSRIYANRVDNGNHWVCLDIRDEATGTYAFGAKVAVYEAGTDRLAGFDELRTDFCYRSKRLPTLHFGLGETDAIDVRVTQRNGRVHAFRRLRADAMHQLTLRIGVRGA